MKKLPFAFLFGLIIQLFVGCAGVENQTATTDMPLRVTDFRGKDLRFLQPANRIVCLIESGLTALYMLGTDDRVVGVTNAVYAESAARQYAALDPRIAQKKLPAAGSWGYIDLETILALQPDLVIIWSSQTEAIAAIEGHGIAVYAVFVQNFADVYKEIRDFGLLTGTSARADSLIDYAVAEVAAIQQRQHRANAKSVYFVWPQGVLETSGKNSTVNELIELAGAKNNCELPQEHVIINKEMLFEREPDVMVFWNNPAKKPEKLIAEAGLSPLKAVRNGQLFELPPVFWCDLWTLKFLYAAKLLAGWCYPASNENLTAENELSQIIRTLYGSRAEPLISQLKTDDLMQESLN